MGEIRRLGEKPLTIDEQIAKHQKEMDAFRTPTDEFDPLVAKILCQYCEYFSQHTIRNLRNGERLAGALHRCFGCGRRRQVGPSQVIETLLEQYRRHGQPGLVIKI